MGSTLAKPHQELDGTQLTRLFRRVSPPGGKMVNLNSPVRAVGGETGHIEETMPGLMPVIQKIRAESEMTAGA